MSQQDILGEIPSPPVAVPAPSAVIGPSIIVRGEVSGDEDLLVRGRVEGSINLPKRRVVVGADGRVQANVHAAHIEVHGTVEGDIRGDEHVAVSATGDVTGNISAPRVSLEDGGRFRGAIDMDIKPERKSVTKPIGIAAADRV
jgi:cytoskeletal protein CcmA (bactofilin family)